MKLVAYTEDLISCCTDSTEVMKRMQDLLDILETKDKPIEWVSEHKYWGIMMDKNLTLIKHTNYLVKNV